MKKRFSNESSQIAASNFLSFSPERFKQWWVENMSRWLEDPYQENLFSPVTEIVTYRDGDIFDGIARIEKSFPAKTRQNYKEGLAKALDKALAEQNMSFSGVLVQVATSLHYNEVQSIVLYHLRAKKTAKWLDRFNIFRRKGVFFDFVLDNIKDAPSAFHSPELTKDMDSLLEESGVEQLNYLRVQNLFLARVRQERDNIGFLAECFLRRINLLLEKKRIDWNNLLDGVKILMNRFDQEQLDDILIAAVQWQKKLEPPQTSYLYKLPNTSDDTTNVDYYGAPWLFWAISNVLGISEHGMRRVIAEVKSLGTRFEKTGVQLSKRESADRMVPRYFDTDSVKCELKGNA